MPVYGVDFDDSSMPEELSWIEGKQTKTEKNLIPFLVDWMSYYDQEGAFTEDTYADFVGVIA